MSRWEAVGVPERVGRYVAALFERVRYNVEHDLPLTMGADAGAFLSWMGMPPRTEQEDRKAAFRSLSGPKTSRNREKSREHRMMRKLAAAFERADD